MCGIVGILDTRERRPVERALLERMNDRQRHRGPDGAGIFIEPGIGFGHRRLSIIDLEGGHQPLFNEDHSVVVVFNGEIYNFPDLTQELEELGHRFATRCDTEVIVHAWEQWGADCVHRFRGMFAFAIWDKAHETLFLARDRLGIKPLYYALLPDGHLIFGSELKALLCHPGLPRRLNYHAVEDYFAYGYIPDPKSIYQDVAKLPPGCRLTVRRGAGGIVPEVYWDIPRAGGLRASGGEIQEELIARLDEAVRIRLISDVPLGSFLSGGVDSSAVVAAMARIGDQPVNTCSIAFDNPQYDESRYAQLVARQYGTNHRSRQVDPQSFDLVDSLATFYDEPFADSSAMPTYRVCELARENVTVALSGDGGDELFAGYRRYRWHDYEERVRSTLPGGLRRPVFGFLGTLYPKLDWAPKFLRAKSTFQALARNSVEGYFQSISVLHDQARLPLFSATMHKHLAGYRAIEVLAGHMAAADTDDKIAQIQYADFKTYLPGDILTKVDRASMAHSLEVRVPILDHEFVEWAVTIPTELKLKDGEGKYIFKKALEPHLPHDILYRDKMGFSVPISDWFRGPLRERVRQTLKSPVLGDAGIFDMDRIATLVDQHQSGRWEHGAPLWSLLMFESFLRQVHNGDGAPGLDSQSLSYQSV